VLLKVREDIRLEREEDRPDNPAREAAEVREVKLRRIIMVGAETEQVTSMMVLRMLKEEKEATVYRTRSPARGLISEVEDRRETRPAWEEADRVVVAGAASDRTVRTHEAEGVALHAVQMIALEAETEGLEWSPFYSHRLQLGRTCYRRLKTSVSASRRL
jgi:hypothetical protein